MRNAIKLLALLESIIPPGKGQRHNITLDDMGLPELTLMLGERYCPVRFDEADLDKSSAILALEIHDSLEALE